MGRPIRRKRRRTGTPTRKMYKVPPTKTSPPIDATTGIFSIRMPGCLSMGPILLQPCAFRAVNMSRTVTSEATIMVWLRASGGSQMVPAPWWKGKRGEWLVVVQVALIALVFLGPRWLPGSPAPAFPFPRVSSILGTVLMTAGAILFLAGLLRLGRNLTPLPYPKEDGTFVQTWSLPACPPSHVLGRCFFRFRLGVFCSRLAHARLRRSPPRLS